MGRGLRGIALPLLSVLLCLAPAAAQNRRDSATATAQYRSITIVSEPKSTVSLNGVRYGTTDAQGRLVIKTVPTGTHTLKVRADGFKEKSQPLSPAQRGEIAIALVKTTDEAELAFQEAERLTAEDREKSAEAYRRAVKLRPNYVEAFIGLARVLSEAGDPEGAMKALAAVRRLRPGFAEASAIEGRIHKDNGDEQKAITAFKRAINEGRGFQPEAYSGLGLLFKEKAEGAAGGGDFDEETAHYEEAAKNLKVALKQLSGAPDTVVIYQLLGLIYERQKKYDEAIATYQEFLTLFPGMPEATAVQSFIVQLKKERPN